MSQFDPLYLADDGEPGSANSTTAGASADTWTFALRRIDHRVRLAKMREQARDVFMEYDAVVAMARKAQGRSAA